MAATCVLVTFVAPAPSVDQYPAMLLLSLFDICVILDKGFFWIDARVVVEREGAHQLEERSPKNLFGGR